MTPYILYVLLVPQTVFNIPIPEGAAYCKEYSEELLKDKSVKGVLCLPADLVGFPRRKE